MKKEEREKIKFHTRLRMLRKEKGYTQAELAVKLKYKFDRIHPFLCIFL